MFVCRELEPSRGVLSTIPCPTSGLHDPYMLHVAPGARTHSADFVYMEGTT